MPTRENDPRKLEDWMVKVEQRLRQLESRRLDAGAGLSQDHATKQMGVKVSEDAGNGAKIGEDGGVYAQDTITTAASHDPLYIVKFTTAAQTNINSGSDTILSWGGTDSTGTWTSDSTSITIPEDGHYIVLCTYPWANNGTGIRAIHMTVNSVTVTTGSRFAGTVPALSNNETLCHFADSGGFTSGDVLRVYGFQSSGLNPLNGGTPYFGDVRGRWTVMKVHDAFPPALTTETAATPA